MRLPKLRSEIDLRPDPGGGGFILKDLLSNEFFEFNLFQVAVMERLDGKHTLEEIAEEVGDVFDAEVPVPLLSKFISQLAQQLLLEPESLDDLPERFRKRAARKALRTWKQHRLFKGLPARGAPDEPQEIGFFRTAERWLKGGDVIQAARALSIAEQIKPDDGRITRAIQLLKHATMARSARSDVPWPMMSLLNPARMLSRIHDMFAFVFSRWFWFLVVGLFLFGLVRILFDDQYVHQLHQMATAKFWTASTVFIFWAVSAGVMIVHEFSHGIGCVHYHGRPNGLGIMLMYYSMPAAFCDVSDTYMMGRMQKVVVFSAGVLSAFVLWSIAAALWFLVKPGTILSRVLFITTIVAGVDNLFNFVPLLRLDGYFVLSALTQRRNLRRDVWVVFLPRLEGWLQRISRHRPLAWLAVIGLVNLAAVPIVVFAALGEATAIIGTFSSVIIFASLSVFWLARNEAKLNFVRLCTVFSVLKILFHIAMSCLSARLQWAIFTRLLGGWGLLVVCFTIPQGIRMLLIEIAEGRPALPARRRQGLYLAVVTWVVLDGVIMSFVPWRLRAVGDAKIEPAITREIRARVPGQVTRVAVKEGQKVTKGQLLIRLANPERRTEVEQARADLKKCQAKLLLLARGLSPAQKRLERRRLARARLKLHDASRKLREKLALSGVIPGVDLVHARASVTQTQSNVAAAAARKRAAVAVDVEVVDAQRLVCKRLARTLLRLDERLVWLDLRAPIDGVVATPHPDEQLGKWVKEGEPLLQVIAGPLRARVVLDERQQFVGLRPGLATNIILRTGSAKPLSGHVVEIVPTSRVEKRVVVKVAFDRPPSWIRPNLSGRAQVFEAPSSLLAALIRPIERFFRFEAWKLM